MWKIDCRIVNIRAILNEPEDMKRKKFLKVLSVSLEPFIITRENTDDANAIISAANPKNIEGSTCIFLSTAVDFTVFQIYMAGVQKALVMGWLQNTLEMFSRKEIVRRLMPVADRLSSFFPNMKKELIQAEMEEKDDVKYLAECIFQSLQLSFMGAIGLGIAGYITGSTDMYWYGLGLFLFIILFGTFTFAKRPKVKANRRTRNLDAELPYALRHILIEVKSGISIYQAMVSVTTDYGEASQEFKKIVADINTGKSEVQALESAVLRNPSKKFRRALWQIINALKSGADVSDTLESLVDSIMEEQILAVEEYGKELNPYTLMYMIIAIIVPSLGVTFMMILSSFTGIELSATLFYVLMIGLVLFQLFFINIVKSKRPVVKV